MVHPHHGIQISNEKEGTIDNTATWLHLREIRLGGESQSQKDTLCVTHACTNWEITWLWRWRVWVGWRAVEGSRGDGSTEFLGCRGGPIRLHVWWNCRELHTHMSASKTSEREVRSLGCTNVNFLVLLLYDMLKKSIYLPTYTARLIRTIKKNWQTHHHSEKF